MNKMMQNKRLVKVSILFSLLVILGCAINPVSGKKQLAFMSEQQEIALGAESDPQIIAEFGLYDNAEIQQFIDKHGQEMAAVSHRPNLKYQFRILDSPVVNAFAVPGGYVYFTRGIMAYFNDEAQFAGVLGHEIGHIAARHSVDQYTKNILGQAVLIGGMLVSKDFRAFANEASTAMQLLFLKYSRDHESQSDQLGVEYSTKVGYDAREMADFFKTLKQLSVQPDGSEIPTFLSTHPDPLDRYAKVEAAATEWQAKVATPPYKVSRDSYLKMVDGIVFGEDPRQGYVENGTFYHPELKFLYPVPANWDLVNSPSQVQMAPADGKALMLLSLAQGNTLQAAAAKDTADLHLKVTGSRQVTINGFQALEVMSKQVSQDPNTGEQSEITVQSVYIQYGKMIYVFHGVATPADFPRYKASFDNTMYGFKELKDQAKINVTPERIKVVAVKKSGTLGQALIDYGVMTSRHRELGIVNGKDVADPVKQGDLIKIIVK